MYHNKITALIISAGLSRRMGKLKPLIEFSNTPFLVHIIQKCSSVCQQIVIVTGYQANHIQNKTLDWLKRNNPELLKSIQWCYNLDFEKGMLTSLQEGLKVIKNTDWILYHFVDQPAIPQQFYNEIATQIDTSYDWIQPQHNKQSGHPILFSKELIPRILHLDANQSLRIITKDQKLKRKLWKCDFPEILQDYDTPDQLKELME